MPADPSLRPRSVSSETQIDLSFVGSPGRLRCCLKRSGMVASAAISSQSNRAQRGTSDNSRRGAVRPAWWVEVTHTGGRSTLGGRGIFARLVVTLAG
jgi:hypothetical protein